MTKKEESKLAEWDGKIQRIDDQIEQLEIIKTKIIQKRQTFYLNNIMK